MGCADAVIVRFQSDLNSIIAGIDDDREVCPHDCLKPVGQLGAAHPAREGYDPHVRA